MYLDSPLRCAVVDVAMVLVAAAGVHGAVGVHGLGLERHEGKKVMGSKFETVHLSVFTSNLSVCIPIVGILWRLYLNSHETSCLSQYFNQKKN